jgi:hypothetical protein
MDEERIVQTQSNPLVLGEIGALIVRQDLV